jgi:OOP family OmpA-OmpF porin
MFLQRSLILAALVGVSACDPQSASKEAPKVSTTPQPETQRVAVRFEFESAELPSDGRKLLDELARQLLAADLEKLTATAHADRIGTLAYNEDLAERRAEAIRDYLLEKGVAEDLVQIQSRGALQPVTQGRCQGMGAENKQNAKLIACLQPDRRAEIEVRRRAAQ